MKFSDIKDLLMDFVYIFFPNNCATCGSSLMHSEEVVCTSCFAKLPRTGFFGVKDNFVEQLFWGKVNIINAVALYYYRKDGLVQELVHLFKYKNRPDVAIFLGKLLGASLAKTPNFQDIEVILPVPLHISRERIRGYNQSLQIALGITEIFERPIDEHSLIRTKKTSTQTKKSRYDRAVNVDKMFEITKKSTLENKHILLIDDVITTGATLEACISAILEVKGTKVSVASVAVASQS